jgi:hypothetical protein
LRFLRYPSFVAADDDEWGQEFGDIDDNDPAVAAIRAQGSLIKTKCKVPVKVIHGKRSGNLMRDARWAHTQEAQSRVLQRKDQQIKKLEAEKNSLISISSRAARATGAKMRRFDKCQFDEMRAEALILAVYQPGPKPHIGINFDRIQATFAQHLEKRERTTIICLFRALADYRRANEDNLACLVYDNIFDGTKHPLSGAMLCGVKINITTRQEVFVIVPRLHFFLMPAGSDEIYQMEEPHTLLNPCPPIAASGMCNPQMLLPVRHRLRIGTIAKRVLGLGPGN